MLNVAILRGSLSSDVVARDLPSGSVVVTLQITTRPEHDGPAVSVPVAWFDAPAWSTQLGAGDEVLVVGSVQRRFFRTGAGTASRVEVRAEAVAKTRDRRRVARLMERVHAALDPDDRAA